MVYAKACMEEIQTIAPARIEKDRMMFLAPRHTCMDHSKLHARGMPTLLNVCPQSLQSCEAIFQCWNILTTFITLGFRRDCRDCLMYRHKKTGPKAGFFFPVPGITWQVQQEQQEQQQRQQQEQQRQQQEQRRQQQEQLPSEQQLPEPEP
jgi:hypothetical protein